MATSWDRYRLAAAAARDMLSAAASAEWSVPASEIAIAGGQLRHAGSGKSAPIGAFAKAAAGLAVPENPALKSKDEWTEIGNPDVKRFDRVGKTKGEQDFTIDVKLPGMLTAVMIHPPKFGATVASFDAAEAKQSPGVVDVVAIHRGCRRGRPGHVVGVEGARSCLGDLGREQRGNAGAAKKSWRSTARWRRNRRRRWRVRTAISTQPWQAPQR